MRYLSDLKHFPEYDNHELVCEIEDKNIGLHAYIAIHNTNLGPATGGTRFFFYNTKDEAIRDALKLSKAMTYKCALAGVPYGGGKGVIIGNPNNIKTDELLKSYAKAINELNGKFTTGEDIGLTKNDIMVLSSESKYVNGRPQKAGELGPWAALGVFRAIQSVLDFKFKSSDINGRTFAVKGLGKVGLTLCQLINENGGNVIGADISQDAIEKARTIVQDIKIVDSSEIHKQKVDVYCPCALGNEFNENTIQELNCEIICGGANNQLTSPDIGEYFHKNKIVYVPDYVANAGGLINIVSEMSENGYNKEDVKNKIDTISNTVKKILEIAQENNEPTNIVADRLAQKIINENK